MAQEINSLNAYSEGSPTDFSEIYLISGHKTAAMQHNSIYFPESKSYSVAVYLQESVDGIVNLILVCYKNTRRIFQGERANVLFVSKVNIHS